ncbi:alpha/beta fold hydrolase [Paraburkholderia phenoliruptrix]|uniref:2-succinyl-6-hydroxy-2, 4-cyclohexadiene-1-carboxylate synthase n=3 Tax=Paraburkholderia phenoliruptrix TaxID=252970 RepID=A0A6J5K590_9BURK|nr:alpha/beta hydrolase [Paraburkholderia phenoliruptrix]AFT86548.1 alpha/beta hydrolase fold protein [Paraburkholderia phenoliruptrix BR3459a]MDR6389315.1 pimeloyl-ACP methyl ester carboxylesterase [Paraburkholderia phenoliruptrix]CAB4048838.1 2-succinyl-6-hydroxy-2, 4-cyclohexadiene-1-carboxylate synthase [Paraburkholderia phenoliruptrix]
MQSPAVGTPTLHFAELPGSGSREPLRIEYRWLNPAAAGAPLAVFLHEGLGSIAMWRDWPQALCERLGLRGLVYSRPGYGSSTPRKHHVKWPVDFMTDQARDILPALLDALKVDMHERRRMWVIGHSDGGSIALLYAALFPDALAGAVVIAPHLFVEDLSVQSIAQTKVLYETTDLRNKLSRYHADVDSAFYGWNDVWLNPAFRQWSIAEQLASIDKPLLAVQGYDDNYGTMAQIDTIARYVAHAQLAKLEACGHSPHRDAPDRLNDVIAAFVSRHAWPQPLRSPTIPQPSPNPQISKTSQKLHR